MQGYGSVEKFGEDELNTWPLETIIVAASLPSALTGSDLAIFMAAFSYLSDITTPKDRTLRVSILDVVYLATMPTGIALGKYLFNLTDQSYTIMFSLNASMLLIAILYTIARLEWQTTPSQQPLNSSTNCCTDFFDKEHVIQSVKTVIKKRPHHRRVYLIILFCIHGSLYVSERWWNRILRSSRSASLKVNDIKSRANSQKEVKCLQYCLRQTTLYRCFQPPFTPKYTTQQLAHSLSAIFWVTVASQVIVFFLMLGIHISLGSRKLEVEETECLATDQTNSEID
ncbi:unnamed protein product [Timema podura]|uniref:Proton-coupled folate transporter n=1 Tax=Timema podura TaxID=61482 RepID=A0ABN7NVU5_TIMPD|nr:unnamed protein product [Timema podura]